LPVVHVAGTNGKGSTSLMIADIMSAAGYQVGRFSSPHLHSYQERFTVNGQEIREDILLFYLEQVETVISFMEVSDCPTEFEILTAIAFLYFRDEKVDLAVLEVGMGGRYDSTNVIKPLVAVISSIDYDHMDYLGNTIEEIAYNKAGIIKPGRPVVIGPMEEPAQNVITAQADQLKARVIRFDKVAVSRVQAPTLGGQDINLNSAHFKLHNLRLALLGDYQLSNLACAVAAVEILSEAKFVVKEEHLVSALQKMKLPGRLEILRLNPLVIGDVAHNPQGAKALSSSLQTLLPGKPRVLVCGMLDDKDRAASLELLGAQSKKAVFTRPHGERSQNWRELSVLWRAQFPAKTSCELENITAAVKKGLELLMLDEYLLITGSFYVLEEARNYFLNSILTLH